MTNEGEWGCRLNLTSIDFLFKVTLFSNFGLQDDSKVTTFLDFPFQVTIFACFGLKVDLK